MTGSSEFYTVTMARLYAGQGYLRKAAEIYRHLAAQNPQDRDVRRALKEIERDIALQKAPTKKDAELLLREWIELMKKKKHKERKKQNRIIE